MLVPLDDEGGNRESGQLGIREAVQGFLIAALSDF